MDKQFTKTLDFIDKAISELEQTLNKKLPETGAYTVEFINDLLKTRAKISRFKEMRKELKYLED